MTSQIISVLVLAAVSLYAVSGQFSRSNGFNSVLFLFVAVLLLLPSVLYLLPAGFNELTTISYSLENTLAYTLLIVLFWGLTMLSDAGPAAVLTAVTLSLVLIWATWDPKWRPLQQVARSFCVLFAMLIATFALIRRQKNGIWMVLSLMSLAFALKPQLLEPLIKPFEGHNYLKALAVFFTGRAFAAGDRPLFGRIAR